MAPSFREYRLRDETFAALDALGMTTPTPIQAQAIPALLDGRDVVGQARTGSGKTLAFGLPLVESVDPDRKAVQALVLAPTRELASQVANVITELSVGRDLKVALVYGGTAPGPQRTALRQGAQVVVGTPGRILDLLNQGALWLDQVRFLVLDEADEMFDQGFAQDVERIMDRTSNSRQTALFSATMPDWVRKTAQKYLYDPVTITVDPGAIPTSPVPHVVYDVPVPRGSKRWDDEQQAKFRALRDLLDHRGPGATIVFGRTKQGVQLLARKLEQARYPVAGLQGNLSQGERDHVMESFRSGRVDILVATNVAARGLDLNDVTLVINVELPESAELLTHRVGRTGRMGRTGAAITLLTPSDSQRWNHLSRDLNKLIERKPWQGAEQALAALKGEQAADAANAEAAALAESAAKAQTTRAQVDPAKADRDEEAVAARPARPEAKPLPTPPRHGPVRHRPTVVDHGVGGPEAHVRQVVRRVSRDPQAAQALATGSNGSRQSGTLRPPWVLDAAARVARWQQGEPAVRISPPEEQVSPASPAPAPEPTVSRVRPEAATPKPIAQPRSPTKDAPRVSAEPIAYAPMPTPKSGSQATSSPSTDPVRATDSPRGTEKRAHRPDMSSKRSSNAPNEPKSARNRSPKAGRSDARAQDAASQTGSKSGSSAGNTAQQSAPQPKGRITQRPSKPHTPNPRETTSRQPSTNRWTGRVATSRCAACGTPISGGRYCADCTEELRRLNQQSDTD